MSTPIFSNVTTPSQVMQLMADGGMTAQQGTSILYNMYNTGLFQNGGSAFVQGSSSSSVTNTPNTATSNAQSSGYNAIGNTLTNQLLGLGGGASMLGSNPTPQQTSQAQKNDQSGIIGFISSHAGNWGVIILGAGLIFAALIISNKETVIKLGEVAAL